MTNGINNADQLLLRILQDAEGEAAKIEAQAAAQAEEIRARAGQEAAALAAQTEARADEAHAEALAHAQTAARLQARKQELSARRVVLEEAFSAALNELCALQGEARETLLVAMAVREADGGETLCPAKAEEAGIAAALQKANAELAKSGRAALTLGKADASIAGGFVLVGSGYEKDCSFEAMLHEAKDALEGGVAKRLFA